MYLLVSKSGQAKQMGQKARIDVIVPDFQPRILFDGRGGGQVHAIARIE